MKTILGLSLLITLVFSSCSVDKLFNVGMRMPSPHSRYAKKKYNEVTVPFDAIIVPGFPFEPGNVPSIMKLRLRWAHYLYNEGLANNIIFSGSAVYSPYVEGIAMKIFADSLGLPADHTFAETQAEHSIENVFYSMRMAHKMGFKRIAVATDPYQARMLEPMMKKYCPGVALVPIVYSKISDIDTKFPAIAGTEAMVNNFVSLKDRETKTQRSTGTKGRRVAHELAVENLHKLLQESGQPELYTQSDSSAVF